MNLLLKKHFWLAAVVISMSVPAANADDLFDDSFFATPAPVDAAAAPAPVAEAPVAAAEPAIETPAPADIPAPAGTPVPAETAADAPAPAVDAPAPEPQLSLAAPLPDAPAPMPDTAIPPPPADSVPAPAGLDFGTPSGGMNLSTPPSEQILGKVSSDIFREMAEMERENNTLMLQLKREQLRSEIDALKTSNRQMLFDEIERREKMTQARLEWELAQDLKRQEALERKQRAEIRQKQIEAALKREEDRRIQKMKEEEAAQTEKEKREKEEQKKQRAELKKKYDAASLVRLNSLKPVLMAATKPAKIKRSTTSRIPKALTSTGEDLLTKKRAGEALTVTVSADEAKENGGVPQESASKLYAVSEIRGTAGSLIAKLISKKDKTTFFAKKTTILPTGHTVIDIDKDYVLVQIGNNKEMIGFPSAGLLSDAPINNNAPAAERDRSEASDDADASEPEPRPKRRKSSPISASAGVRASLSGASLAR